MRVDDAKAKFDTLTKSEERKYDNWVNDLQAFGWDGALGNLGDANPEKIGMTWRLRISQKNRICCEIIGDTVKVMVVGNPRGH